RQLGEIELEQGWIGDECAGDLGPRERRLDLLRAARSDHDRPALLVSRLERLDFDRIQYERLPEIELALERDLGHAPSRRSEPALSHSSTVSPGSMRSTWDLVSFASASGVPVSSGNVPQWHGTQRGLPRSSRAIAAASGPIV